MAYLFGKETFEGGSLPGSFTEPITTGTGNTITIDNTSAINGTFSAKCHLAGLGTRNDSRALSFLPKKDGEEKNR